MIKLKKFYDLVGRNATVTLANQKLNKVYFEGSVRDIPDEYDNWTVIDFSTSIDGDFLFKVEK